jgi:hypothetical protein
MILQGLKHIGVMKTPENVVDEDGGDEAWEHCDNPTRDNSVLSPKPLLLVIKR